MDKPLLQKHIIFAVRFSVLAPSKGGTLLASGSLTPDEYRDKLFSEDRISERLHLFEEITLRSLKYQKPSDAQLHLIVVTSDVLPEDMNIKLSKILKEFSSENNFSATIMYAKSGFSDTHEGRKSYKKIDDCLRAYLKDYIGEEKDFVFATVRLDDDDGLAASYCERLSSLLERGLYGLPVSYAYGYEGFYDKNSGSFRSVKHWYHPKIALGLAFINKFEIGKGFYDDKCHIYNLGRHTRIDETYPILIDSTFPAYFRTISSHNDSGASGSHDYLLDLGALDMDGEEFRFISNVIDQKPEGSSAIKDWTPSRCTSERAMASKLKSDIKNMSKVLASKEKEISKLKEMFGTIKKNSEKAPVLRNNILSIIRSLLKR